MNNHNHLFDFISQSVFFLLLLGEKDLCQQVLEGQGDSIDYIIKQS